MKPKVLVTEPIHRVGWNLLTTEAEAVAWAGPQAEPLAQALEEAQGVIVRSARLPGDIIRGAKQLRIIAKHGAGVEKIDVAAATACGVVVTSTPAANAQSVAELALALLLSVARRIGEYTRDLSLGKPRPRQTYEGIELQGRVLGIIGLGEIGLRVGQLAGGALGMRVLAYDPYRDPWPEGIERVRSLDALLGEADCLSIHVPLTEETRKLIGPAALARVRPTCILVNTSRGEVVDEVALAEAIQGGRLAGAGLDVVVDEPIRPDHPLAGLPNVLLTPHLGSVTEDGLMRMARAAAEEVLRVLQGKAPRYPVNPEALAKPNR